VGSIALQVIINNLLPNLVNLINIEIALMIKS